MRAPARTLLTCLAAVAALAAGAPGVRAEPVATSLDSEPRQADVYLLKGLRRERLGTTPLVARLPFRSAQSVLKLEFAKAGYAAETVTVTAGGGPLVVRLEPAPLFAPSDGREAPGMRATKAALAERLSGAWPQALAAVDPWRAEGPALLETGAHGPLLHVPLTALPGTAAHRVSAEDARRLGDAFAAEVGTRLAGQVDAVVLSLRHAARGRVGTRVGTRTVTEMVCEGGTVMAPVWDSCATRSTSSTSATGYQCMGGTVYRQTFDPCARRVPRQRAEVALETTVIPGVIGDETRVVVTDAGVVGTCRYVGGRRAGTSGDSGAAAFRAACPD